ncbi:MAG: FAD-dependent monooxygenase [Pseudomonadota bacterium]
MSSSFHLLILGGGIVGKACALALAQSGLDVTLLGARPAGALPAHGYAQRIYALNAASKRWLDALRVWPQVPQERIEPIRAMRIRADGAQLVFDSRDAQGEALAWTAESDAIEAALDLALRFERRVVIDPAQAGQISRLPDAPGWQVTTRDGRTLRADLLIGADGEHSLVRRVSGIAMDTHDYMQRGIVANFDCAAPHEGVAFQTFVEGGVLALLPLASIEGRHQVSLVWSAPEALAVELLALPPEALAQRVQAHLSVMGAQHLGPLQPTGTAAAWRLQRQLARRTVGDALVLIGDAAHRVHPLAGQGLNLGLQDAQVLAQVLQQRPAAQSPADPRLLRRYARARAEQVLALATTTDALARLYGSHSRVPAPLRALGLQATHALSPVRHLLARYASGLPYLA